MIDYHFYKSLYEREQDLRIAYDNRLDYTITLTVAIATADAFLCESIAPWHGSTYLPFFFFICITLLVLLTVHVVFICLAYTSLKFRYQDFPVDLIEPDLREHLSNFLRQHPHATIEEIEENFKRYALGMLAVTYRSCATIYYKENIRRRKFHFYLNITSVVNAIVVIIFYVIIFLFA